MSHDEFTKLFQYMQEQFDHIDKRFDDIHNDIDGYISAIDVYIQRSEINEQERLALTNQVDHHEAWITQAAPKVGIKFKR